MAAKFKKSIKKTKNTIAMSLPIVFGVLFLISLFNQLVDIEHFKNFFGKNIIWDSFLGATAGSLAVGNPITSYILGGELLKSGVSLLAVTAFILTWVTVGVVQLPAEILILGKRYALIRNAVSFASAIIISILVWIII